jgi:hypothetical protein
MKTFLSRTLVCSILMIMSIVGCESKNDHIEYIIDKFAENTYYTAEIFSKPYQGIYGLWKLDQISGGIHGGGHDPNFEFLKVKRFGIYGFIDNDSLLEYGRIVIGGQTEDPLLITFEPDEHSGTFTYDAEKYVHLYGNDTLLLASPCCDRYNYHFIREQQ